VRGTLWGKGVGEMGSRSILAVAALAALLAACLGGSGPFSGVRESALREAVEDYAKNLRWNRVAEAAAFVHPDHRVSFVRFVRETEGTIRFTAFEVESVDHFPESGSGSAIVTFHLYRPPVIEEQVLTESQDWTWSPERKRWYLLEPDTAAYRGEVAARLRPE
jgi:hypothetical protein